MLVSLVMPLTTRIPPQQRNSLTKGCRGRAYSTCWDIVRGAVLWDSRRHRQLLGVPNERGPHWPGGRSSRRSQEAGGNERQGTRIRGSTPRSSMFHKSSQPESFSSGSTAKAYLCTFCMSPKLTLVVGFRLVQLAERSLKKSWLLPAPNVYTLRAYATIPRVEGGTWIVAEWWWRGSACFGGMHRLIGLCVGCYPQ